MFCIKSIYFYVEIGPHVDTAIGAAPKANTMAARSNRLFNTPKKMLTQYTSITDEPPYQSNYTINLFRKDYMYISTPIMVNCPQINFIRYTTLQISSYIIQSTLNFRRYQTNHE